MTAADLACIRARAAPDVKETHSRQQLILRIKRQREDVEALAEEVERLNRLHLDASRSAEAEHNSRVTEVESLRRRVAAYESRLEREWKP